MAPSPSPALDVDLSRLTLRTLTTCWLAQALLAAAIGLFLPIPVRPLLIDRGPCGQEEWRALLARYSELHLQDRLGQQRFSPVIQVSVFGERETSRPPAPGRLAENSSVGVREGARLMALQARLPGALVLSCDPTDSP